MDEILNKIIIVRGERVILDEDLARFFVVGERSEIMIRYNLLKYKENIAYEEVRENFYDNMNSHVKNSNNNDIDNDLFGKHELIEVEFFTRYLFSLLTDADCLDTEKHFDPKLAKMRRPKQLQIDEMIDLMDHRFNKYPKSGEINELRNLVRNEAILKAKFPIGFYSLNFPTGLGKTLTSFYWAWIETSLHIE